MDGRRFDADVRRRAAGARLIGVDEAGRGPLAGPVVAAAVVLPEEACAELDAARDSKVLSARERERLFAVIRSRAAAVSVAWSHSPVIDRDNILRATLDAMGRAARRAARKAGGGDFLAVVDGPRRIPDFPLPQEAVVDGDAKSLSVAAASIVAKVVRDRWMGRLDRRHPGYGFARHKGYGTEEHLEALERLGPCRLHRRSYAPVARRLAAPPRRAGGGAMNRIEAGRKAEEMAAALLQAKGMSIVERNFRAKTGEIDLVARDGEEIVFVEVRSRASRDFGGAAASVDRAKRLKLVRAARLWLAARGWDGACRFDVVAAEGGRLEHLPDAFGAGGS